LMERRSAVHAHRRSRVPFTMVETGIIIARHVPVATHHIVDVVAERRRLGCVLATTETKLVGSNEICPLVQLFQLARESGREDKTSNRVTIAGRAMGIQFSSGIPSWNIYFGQVANTSDLNIIRGLYKVRASDGTARDKTRSITRLDTPSHFDLLGVADDRSGSRVRRGENTKVVKRVHVGILA